MNLLASQEIQVRITDTPCIKNKHRELSLREITNNPEEVV